MGVPVIYQGGGSVAVSGWTVTESLWSYCAEVRMTVLGGALSDPVWYLDEYKAVPYIAVQAVSDTPTQTSYVSWPKVYYDQCNVMSPPVNLKGTIVDLCQSLGMSLSTVHDSSLLIPLRWVLGAMRGRKLFDELAGGAACTGGGCSTLFYNVGGSLQYTDLLALRGIQDSAFTFTGQIEPVSMGFESGVVAPGAVDFWFDDEGGPAEVTRMTFLSQMFVGGYRGYLASSELRSRREWQYRNRFWRSFIRNRVCRFRGVSLVSGALLCGVPCSYVGSDGTSVRYICTGYTNRINGDASEITLECYQFVEEE